MRYFSVCRHQRLGQSLWILAAVVAVLCETANAQSSYCTREGLSGPMRATHITLGDSRVLLLMGGFRHAGSADSKYGTHNDVANAIRRANSYEEIWLCSGGGNVQEGYKVGREFVTTQAKVRVPAGFSCVSSCTNAFLGGYLRTIDRDASFGIHSSSGVMRLKPQQIFLFECSGKSSYAGMAATEACQRLEPILTRYEKQRCRDVDAFQGTESCLAIGLSRYGRLTQIAFKLELFMSADLNRADLEAFNNVRSREKWAGVFEMIQYYQEMLNDGNRSRVNYSAYTRLLSDASWPDVYGSTDSLRDLTVDTEELKTAETTQAGLIKWQDLLTEIEIAQQKTVIEFLRQHQTELGRGGKEALNILQATINCRIQSVCYPDRNALARLGYHNFDID